MLRSAASYIVSHSAISLVPTADHMAESQFKEQLWTETVKSEEEERGERESARERERACNLRLCSWHCHSQSWGLLGESVA